MVVALVLLACEAGRYHEVAERIAKIEHVTMSVPCFGRWDCYVRVDAPDMKTLTEAVLKINATKDVRATETLIRAEV